MQKVHAKVNQFTKVPNWGTIGGLPWDVDIEGSQFGSYPDPHESAVNNAEALSAFTCALSWMLSECKFLPFFPCCSGRQGKPLVVSWVPLLQNGMNTVELSNTKWLLHSADLDSCLHLCRGVQLSLCFYSRSGQLRLKHAVWRSYLFPPLNSKGSHAAPNQLSLLLFF